MYKATIEVLLDVANEAEAADCMAEALRPLLREFNEGSCIVDWRYDPRTGHNPAPHDSLDLE